MKDNSKGKNGKKWAIAAVVVIVLVIIGGAIWAAIAA